MPNYVLGGSIIENIHFLVFVTVLRMHLSLFFQLFVIDTSMGGKSVDVELNRWVLDKIGAYSDQNTMLVKTIERAHLHFGPPPTFLTIIY